jgi:tetratricopeptide (TPR) repeat protein
MHEVFVAGDRTSIELSQLRDGIDEPYLDMTEEERDAIEGLSTDLFDVERINSEPHLESRPPTNEKIQSALAAQHSGRYDESLKILRENKSLEPPSRISYFRGRIWEEKGEPRVALLFFNHAAKLDRENDEYKAAALEALDKSFPRERKTTVGAPDTVLM